MTNDVYVGETFDEYLEHHGILGMHWGIRRTPEQLGHKLAKKRKSFEKYSEKAKAAGEAGNVKKLNRYTKKAARINKQAVKLDKNLSKDLKKQADNDEKLVKTGSVDDVLSISHRLSEDQINRAIRRIQNQQKLEGLRPDPTKQVDKLINVGKKAAEIGQTAYNVAHNFSQFRDVMKDISEKDIKARKANIEEGRKNRVLQATRSGDIEQMKKVWGEANVNELRDMKSALDYRNQIIALSEKQKNTSKKKK
jgi:hypothetical protein